MRVLMIPSFFRNTEYRSSGSFFTDQAILMQERGHTVSIIYADTYSIKYIGDYLNYKEYDEILSGVPVHRDKAFTPFKRKGFLGNQRRFVRCCLKIVKKNYPNQFPFDIIHAQNCVWAGAAARALSERYGVPYVVTEHSSMYELATEKDLALVRKNVQLALDGASGVICVSDKLRSVVQKYTSNEILVIGNVVDVQSYSLIDRKMNKEKPFVFTSVAFLQTENRIKLKGIDLLIQGFQRFAEKNPNAILKIIGVPKKITMVSELVLAAGLKDKVQIIEPLDREKIFEEYKKTNCFVLLGKYETFGLVYAEAMATGLPVIATDVGIVSEIISDASGEICKERTPECVENALLNVYLKYQQYNPHELRQTITSRYSKEIVGKQIEDAYIRAVHSDINDGRKTK
ncbi:MAG: glycosyltransferase [Eubacteriales bacterium]|nr:glycosyltransferase [Eubacteriales bacterium]